MTEKQNRWLRVIVVGLILITILYGVGLFVFWKTDSQQRSAVAALSALLLLFVNAAKLFPKQFGPGRGSNTVIAFSVGCDIIILAMYAYALCHGDDFSLWSLLPAVGLLPSPIMLWVSAHAEKNPRCAEALWCVAVFFAVLAFVPIFIS